MHFNTDKRIAVVFGATGLVGNYLVQELINDESYSFIDVFVRKSTGNNHVKVREYIIDFSRLEERANLINGNDLFICLGTTIRKAGSVKRVEEIDRDLPVRLAQIAFSNGVKKVAVVSSMGANPYSRHYYMRIKGEMESGILKIPFDQTVIARPSMLFGRRNEFRFGENVGKMVMKTIGFLLIGSIRKYRGIHDQTVAAAMIELLRSPQSKIVYLSDELQKFGKK